MSRPVKILFLFTLLALLRGQGGDALALDGGSAGILSPVDGNVGILLKAPTPVSSVAQQITFDSTRKALRVGDGTYARLVGSDPINVGSLLSCTGTDDDRAKLAALVATGGECAGKHCLIPSWCHVLLSSPGTSAPAITMATGTVLEFQYGSSVDLATKVCVGGDFPGAWCSTVADCPSSSACDYVGAAGSPAISDVFAPTGGSTYTVFGPEDSYVHDVTILGTAVNTGQMEGYGRCVGANAGKVCDPRCSTLLSGQAVQCDDDTICGVLGGTCVGDNYCGKTDCTAAPKSPAGDGKITVYGFSGISNVRIENTSVRNSMLADPIINVGTYGVVLRAKLDSYVEAVSTHHGLVPWSLTRTIAQGIVAASDSQISNSTVRALLGINASSSEVRGNRVRLEPAGSYGINVTGSSVLANKVTLDGEANQIGIRIGSNWSQVVANEVQGGTKMSGSDNVSASIGIQVGGAQNAISANIINAGGYGVIPQAGSGIASINNNINANRIYGQRYLGVGGSTGWIVTGNYVAWTKAVALATSFYNSLTYHLNTHGMYSGNLFHADQESGVSGVNNHGPIVLIPDLGLRCAHARGVGTDYNSCSVNNDCRVCVGGSNPGTLCPAGTGCTGGGTCSGAKYCSNSVSTACTSDANCPSALAGSCRDSCVATQGTNSLAFSANTIYSSGPGVTGFEIANSSTVSPVENVTFSANSIVLNGGSDGGTTSKNFVFPSGSGQNLIRGIFIGGNALGLHLLGSRPAVNFTNWNWAMGTIASNEGMNPTDEQATVAVRESGTTVDYTDKAVSFANASDAVGLTDGSTRQAPEVVGIAKTFISSVSSPHQVKVAVGGSTICTVNGRDNIALGDRLKLSSITSGVGVRAADWEPAFAVAQEAYSTVTDGTIRCQYQQSPGRPESPSDQVHLYDDFLTGSMATGSTATAAPVSNLSVLGWTQFLEGNTGSCGSSGQSVGTNVHPGLFDLQINATNNRGCWLYSASTSFNALDLASNMKWLYKTAILGSQTVDVRLFAGFTDATTGVAAASSNWPANMIAATVDTTGGDTTHWRCSVCKASSCSHIATTNGNYDTSNWRAIQLRYVPNGYVSPGAGGTCSQSGGCLECKIGTEVVINNSTATPVVALQPFFLVATHGAATKKMSIDYFDFRLWGMSR